MSGKTEKSCGAMERIVEVCARDQERAARFVARSFYKVLRRNGFSKNQVIDVASHLIDALVTEMRTDSDGMEPVPATGSIKSA